jgi:hypothetical protein
MFGGTVVCCAAGAWLEVGFVAVQRNAKTGDAVFEGNKTFGGRDIQAGKVASLRHDVSL